MAEHENKVLRVLGGIYVKFPEAAYNVSWLSKGTEIPPCKDCAFNDHLEKLNIINAAVSKAKLLKDNLRLKQIHRVQVFEYKGQMHVKCECNCCAETVKTEND